MMTQSPEAVVRQVSSARSSPSSGISSARLLHQSHFSLRTCRPGVTARSFVFCSSRVPARSPSRTTLNDRSFAELPLSRVMLIIGNRHFHFLSFQNAQHSYTQCHHVEVEREQPRDGARSVHSESRGSPYRRLKVTPFGTCLLNRNQWLGQGGQTRGRYLSLMTSEKRSTAWAQRLPYIFAAVILGTVIATFLVNSGSTDPLGHVLFVLVPICMGIGFFRMPRQDQRAKPTRESVLEDTVVAEFPRVQVQLNPGTSRTVALKGGPFGVEFLVQSHSFEVGPAPPLRGSFRYYFEANETVMEASRERFSNFWVRDCILLSGSYGNDDMSVAVDAKDATLQLWSALISAGVRTRSGPPTR